MIYRKLTTRRGYFHSRFRKSQKKLLLPARVRTEVLRYEASLPFAKAMDDSDPLKNFRERFHIPEKTDGEPSIYFCGNSLGLQPKSVRAYIEQELKDWETLGVEGHFHAR